MKALYLSGSDMMLFYPPEILAAALIYLGNLKCLENSEMTHDMKTEFGLDNFLELDNPKEPVSDHPWIQRVVNKYSTYFTEEVWLDAGDVQGVIEVILHVNPELKSLF